MATGETETLATRLPADEVSRVRDAADQLDTTRSDVLARALGFYVEQNPDDVPALRSREPDPGPLQELGILPMDLGDDPDTER